MRKYIAFALVTLVGSLAFGDAKPPAAPPLPPEAKRIVDGFSGAWTFEGTVSGLPGMKEPLKVKETMQCRKGGAGRLVACTGKGTSAMGGYEDEALIGYDANGKAVHFVGMDSMGVVHDHKCNWKDDKTLACEPLQWTGDDGQPATVDLTVTWSDPKTIKVVETTTAKDGSKMAFEGTGKRK